MSAFSVVVPVKNGARWLAELIEGVHAQDEPAELLVIDSGSSDDSVRIARDGGARVLEIPPESFGHGRTRNLGMQETASELVVFLTQDATPVPGWLAAYREAMALDPRAGAAYGPHLPREDTSPMIARELTEFFATFSPDGTPAVQRGPDAPTFLSNVNACYRRDCWEEIRFDDVAYSEDQAFGKAMLAAGWAKVYHPRAAVLHAHDYGPLEFMRRYFDEYRGLRTTLGHVEPLSLRGVRGQVKRDVAYGGRRWAPRSAVHHAGRRVFSALGSRADRLPAPVQAAISLEGTAPVAAAAPAAGRATTQVPAGGRTAHAFVLDRAREGSAPLLDALPGQSEKTPLHLAFVIPPFRRGSGGHNSIFQMVSRLERAGHTCSVWLHDPEGWLQSDWAAVIRGNVSEFFAPFSGPAHKGFDEWRGADVAVATGWESAWPVMGLPDCRARAYLVHDHENEFFPTSAQARWAEQTYGFDLYPIASSPWLRTLMTERYGAPEAGLFDFGVDHDVYFPRPVERRRDTVIFYARGVTARRAVPLGLLALEELHRRRPDVRIVLFGDSDPTPAPFPYEHLGVASPEELSVAYCESTVGVVLSMTNYSLIPKEMLACGLPCIDLEGFSSETVFGAEGPVELSEFDPIALCNHIEHVLDDREDWERRSAEGIEFVREHTWDRAAVQVENGLRAALRRRETEREAHARRAAEHVMPAPRLGDPHSRAVPVDAEPPVPEGARRADLSAVGEAEAIRLLAELHAAAGAGGRLLITARGFQSIAGDAVGGRRNPRQCDEIRGALYRYGYWHGPDGTSYLTPEWIARHALPAWRLDDYAVGEPDTYLLSRR